MGRPLFWFPYNVNDWLTRLVGILVFAFSACLPIIFRNKTAMHYACAWFAFDFFARFIGGARMSFLGHLAEIIMIFGQLFGKIIGKPIFPRNLIVGPPKQFAVFCGLILSTIATVLLFLDYSATRWVGGALFIVLALLAGLEGFFGICVACKMFSWYQVHVGWILTPTSMNYPNEIYDEMEEQAHEFDDRVEYPKPTASVYRPEGFKVSLTSRTKRDPYYRQHFHPIKHMSVTWFVIPLSVVGLAAVYKLRYDMRNVPRHETMPKAVWIVIASVGAAISAVVLFLNLVRLVCYPRKFLKDWDHPIRFAAFSIVPLIILLFAYVLIGQTSDGGPLALFWIGAPIQMVLAVVFVARLIHDGYYRCWQLPVWLLAPVGTLVAAIVCASVRRGSEFYHQLSWLFWSFAFFMWIPLFVISFQRLAVGGRLPDLMRPQVTFYMATPAVACVAYFAMQNTFDFWFRTLYYLSLGFLAVMFVLMLKYYFGRDRFNLSYWAYGFSLDTIALATMLYFLSVPSKTTEILAWAAIVLATGMNIYLSGITVVELLRGHLLLPEPKFGALQFLRATHYAFRHASAQLVQLAGYGSFTLDSEGFASDLNRFETLFTKLSVTHEEHARHEDLILFPSIESFWPGAPPLRSAGAEHQRDHADSHALRHALDILKSADESRERKAAALENLKTLTVAFAKHIVEHIENEEDNLAGFQRKPHGCKLQKDLVRRMWEITPADRWRVYVDLLMNHVPLHQYRLAFLKSITSVLPERAEQLGVMVYNCVSKDLWSRLLDDVPDLIPRGFWRYHRYW